MTSAAHTQRALVLWRRVESDVRLFLGAVGFLLLCIMTRHFGLLGPNWLLEIEGDWRVYHDAALRFLDGRSYFTPDQLAPAHVLTYGDVLYPPTALWLFVPMALLPPIVWHLVPVLVAGAALWRLRPSAWGWVGIAWLAAWPVGPCYLFSGNPLTWAVACLFAAVAWDVPASLLLLMPSLLPFAFYRCNRRRWWLGLLALVLLSLPLLSLNITWLRVILGTSGTGGPLYGIRDWPTMCIPLVAAASATRRVGRTVAGPAGPP